MRSQRPRRAAAWCTLSRTNRGGHSGGGVDEREGCAFGGDTADLSLLPAGDAAVRDGGEAVVVYDLDGKLHEVNAAACALLGYSRDELLQRTMLDLRPGI